MEDKEPNINIRAKVKHNLLVAKKILSLKEKSVLDVNTKEMRNFIYTLIDQDDSSKKEEMKFETEQLFEEICQKNNTNLYIPEYLTCKISFVKNKNSYKKKNIF